MKGIVPSLNTPFEVDGALDPTSLKRLVNHTIEAGCGGMLGLAVAGESNTLSLREKLRFIDVVVDTNASRIPFIVSVTDTDPKLSVELAKKALNAGATGLCVQIPDSFERARKVGFLQELSQYAPDILMVQDLDWTGGGMALDEIVYLFENVAPFTWIKIETLQAGPKYSAVLKETDNKLNVCGGWAVTQLMDALARGVHAFIPTGMELVYVRICAHYDNGDIAAARSLFEKVLPVLNFSNQHINTSIRFFKELRKAEGLFETNVCRLEGVGFDPVQQKEAEVAVRKALALGTESAL